MSKVVIIVLLLAMVASLGAGLYYLLRTPSEGDTGEQLYKSLRLRIGIWVVLLGFIVLSIQMGWIKPSNSIHPAQFNQEQKERIDRNAEPSD